MKAILTIGVSASGKTTWAKDFIKTNPSFVDINRDDCRKQYIRNNIGREVDVSLWEVYKFSKAAESWVTQYQQELIQTAFNDGKDVIISDTNLNDKIRNGMISFLESVGFSVEINVIGKELSFFDVLKRDFNRKDRVGESVLMKQWVNWRNYLGQQTKQIISESKQNIILCDLDGTLAYMGNRGAFEWNKVGDDSPNMFLSKMLTSWLNSGEKVVFLSGRSDECAQLTKDWIIKNVSSVVFGDNAELFMRKAGDNRKDYIVKEELYMANVAPLYNVMAVFDDRPQVVRLWVWLGLPVYAHGNPYIDF